MEMSPEETFERVEVEGIVPLIHFHTNAFISCGSKKKKERKKERKKYFDFLKRKKAISHALQLRMFFKSHFTNALNMNICAPVQYNVHLRTF